jgi:hypothetical protein
MLRPIFLLLSLAQVMSLESASGALSSASFGHRNLPPRSLLRKRLMSAGGKKRQLNQPGGGIYFCRSG